MRSLWKKNSRFWVFKKDKEDEDPEILVAQLIGYLNVHFIGESSITRLIIPYPQFRERKEEDEGGRFKLVC